MTSEAGPSVLFRADATIRIGAGHLQRCLTLAEELAHRGAAVTFLTNPEAKDIVPALASSGLQVLSCGDAADPVAALEAAGSISDVVVFDHYGIDAREEERFRRLAKALVAIDDLADRLHDVDLLIDMTWGREPLDYAALVPPTCSIRCGSEWQLVRPEFARHRPQSLARRSTARPPRNVLIGLGGTDPLRLTSVALIGLSQACDAADRVEGDELRANVVMSSATPGVEEVAKLLPSLPYPAQLQVDTSEMAALMADADVAIGAAGSMTWERCCLGLPALQLVVADNQLFSSAAVARTGAAISLDARAGLTAEALARGVQALCRDWRMLPARARAAATICDGRGTERTADLVLDVALRALQRRSSS